MDVGITITIELFAKKHSISKARVHGTEVEFYCALSIYPYVLAFGFWYVLVTVEATCIKPPSMFPITIEYHVKDG